MEMLYEANVTIPMSEYQKLTGTEQPAKYPRVVNVPNDHSYMSGSFSVYLGSDGHEYVSHEESHNDDQWTHYGGCELCKSRYDTLLLYIKNK
jgi:hypothetical protein